MRSILAAGLLPSRSACAAAQTNLWGRCHHARGGWPLKGWGPIHLPWSATEHFIAHAISHAAEKRTRGSGGAHTAERKDRWGALLHQAELFSPAPKSPLHGIINNSNMDSMERNVLVTGSGKKIFVYDYDSHVLIRDATFPESILSLDIRPGSTAVAVVTLVRVRHSARHRHLLVWDHNQEASSKHSSTMMAWLIGIVSVESVCC